MIEDGSWWLRGLKKVSRADVGLLVGEGIASRFRASASLLVGGLGPAMAGCGATVVLGQVSAHWWVRAGSKARACSWVGESGNRVSWLVLPNGGQS